MCSTSTQAIVCIIDRARILSRVVLLNKNAIEGKHKFPNSYTFNRGLPKVKSIAGKHWHILYVTPKYNEIFFCITTTVSWKNKIVQQIIGSNIIEHNKKLTRYSNKCTSKCSFLVFP